MRTLKLSIILIVLWTGSANSYTSESLGLIEQVGVDINMPDSDPDNLTCGLTQSDMRAAAGYPIIGTGLELSDKSPARLIVTLITLYMRSTDSCTTAYSSVIWVVAPTVLGSPVGGMSNEFVVLWENGGILTSARPNHAQRVRDTVQNLSRTLAVAWSAKRPKKDGLVSGLPRTSPRQ